MPDITPAQILGVVGAGIAVVVAFGIHLSDTQVQTILVFVGAVLALVFGSDAAIRRGRAANADKIALAQTAAPQPTAAETPELAPTDTAPAPKTRRPRRKP